MIDLDRRQLAMLQEILGCGIEDREGRPDLVLQVGDRLRTAVRCAGADEHWFCGRGNRRYDC